MHVSDAECEVSVARVITVNTLQESHLCQAHLCRKYIKQHVTVLTNDIITSCRTAGMESIHFRMTTLICLNLLKLIVLKFELSTAYRICQRTLASRTIADCEHALVHNLLALCWETSITAVYVHLYRPNSSVCHLLFALDCCCGNVKNAYRSISRSMQPCTDKNCKRGKHRFWR